MNYIYSDQPTESAANSTAKSIIKNLASGKKVLWLMSGGSGIPVAKKVSDMISGYNLSNLTVSLTDERYGPINHTDENWKQIIETGLKLTGAKIYRPLSGESVKKTTDNFNSWLKEQFKINDYKIGLFGIGSDSHTAGIKPGCVATASEDYAVHYTGEDFERITVTFPVVRMLDEAIIQATGIEKKPALKKLVEDSANIKNQPAQILKQIKVSILYSNNKREDL